MTKISVIGSGVIGLSIALELALNGLKTNVITRDLSEATSWVAGGMLAPFSEGLEGEIFEFSYESLKLYETFVNKISDLSKQRVDIWMDGINRVVFNNEEDLLRKADIYSKNYKVSVYKNPRELILGISQNVNAIVHYMEEGWVDVYSLMEALIEALKRLGVEIIHDNIVKVDLKDGEVQKLIGVRNEYTADQYVFCLGAWTKQLFDVPIYPIKGQALKLNARISDRVLYSSASYIIPRSLYTYIGATSEEWDFSKKITVQGILSLTKGLMDVLPNVGDVELLEALVGFRPCTKDQLPVFEVGKNYVYAGGHCRNGILHAPITSKVVLDYIYNGRMSKYMDAFSSQRFKR